MDYKLKHTQQIYKVKQWLVHVQENKTKQAKELRIQKVPFKNSHNITVHKNKEAYVKPLQQNQSTR